MRRPGTPGRPARLGCLLGGCLSAVLTLVACGGADGADRGVSAACRDFEQYGDHSGETIIVLTPFAAPADGPQIDSYLPFESCTGATVLHQGAPAIEARLLDRIDGGNPPDLAYIPRPGLLRQLVADTDAVKPAPGPVSRNVDRLWGQGWKAYGTVDGTFYAAPLDADVESLVWYSPRTFASKGFAVPGTWDELISLSDRIAATGERPWCAGFSGDDPSGRPGTDWLEDVMLREVGPDVYDLWTRHEIPFNDPQVVAALERVGSVLRNDRYVNAGFGDVPSIARTTYQEAGLPILEGRCHLYRAGAAYAASWPEGTDIAPDGDVFAFYLPPVDDLHGRPVLGRGTLVAAFADRPEVQDFQAYLSSGAWANEKAKATPRGGWVSANRALDVGHLRSPIDRLAAEILLDPRAVFRSDASELMPPEVGAGTFPRGMTEWVEGRGSQATLDFVEASWPGQ